MLPALFYKKNEHNHLSHRFSQWNEHNLSIRWIPMNHFRTLPFGQACHYQLFPQMGRFGEDSSLAEFELEMHISMCKIENKMSRFARKRQPDSFDIHSFTQCNVRYYCTLLAYDCWLNLAFSSNRDDSTFHSFCEAHIFNWRWRFNKLNTKNTDSQMIKRW